MDEIKFRELVISEKRSQRHLKRICRIIGGYVCPRCGCNEIYEIEQGNRRRCPECGYRFTLYSGRYLDKAHISPKAWLWVIKLFELELTATRISVETEISYPTTLKAITAIRRSISAATAHRRAGSPDLEGNRKPLISHTIEHEGIEATVILPTNRIKIVERLEHGHLICTDRDVRHDSLFCEGVKHDPADFGHNRLPRFRTYLAHPVGARIFIMERLHKYHGLKDKMLPLYVLEMEYRYNNRRNQLFNLLVENICRFVPVRHRDAVDMNAPSV